jgi:hypothetical protein
MTNFYHKDKQSLIFNGIDNSIVSHTNTIELIGAAELFRPTRTGRCDKRVDSQFEPLLNL